MGWRGTLRRLIDVGRDDPEKPYRTQVEAWRKLQQTYPQISENAFSTWVNHGKTPWRGRNGLSADPHRAMVDVLMALGMTEKRAIAGIAAKYPDDVPPPSTKQRMPPSRPTPKPAPPPPHVEIDGVVHDGAPPTSKLDGIQQVGGATRAIADAQASAAESAESAADGTDAYAAALTTGPAPSRPERDLAAMLVEAVDLIDPLGIAVTGNRAELLPRLRSDPALVAEVWRAAVERLRAAAKD